ncbi:MAG TPA: glycosyltransferase family 39 protein [Ktedonobacterales bacterium]|jgi:alpha-1,6-mannosyltransferase
MASRSPIAAHISTDLAGVSAQAHRAGIVTLRRLALVALVMEGFFLALWAVAPLGGVTQSHSPLVDVWPWLLAPARVIFGETLVATSMPPADGWLQLALFALLLVGVALVAAWGLLIARRAVEPPYALAFALGTTALFALTLALLPSLPSDDLFSYILYGRISAVHHANPLVVLPSDFPNDPFLQMVYWRDVRSVYGPVWLALSGGLSLLAETLGGSLAIYTALFKLLGVAAHLLNAWLVWLILGRLAPKARLLGTLFYAWSPLCLLEFGASAHNDALMLTFLLLGVYCLTRATSGGPGWDAAAMVAFGLSIATKYVPLALIPLYFALVIWTTRGRGASWRETLGAVAWRGALLAGTILLALAPYWAGSQTINALLFSPPAQQLDNSLLESLSWPLRWLAEGVGLTHTAAKSLVESLLKALALLAFLALYLWEFRRARTLPGMLAGWGWILLWYALVASGWFWPWYVTWAVGVVALCAWGRLSMATLLLAGGALTLYGFLPLQSSPVYGYRSLVVFGPALVYLIRQAWMRRDALRDELAGTLTGIRAWTSARVMSLRQEAR